MKGLGGNVDNATWMRVPAKATSPRTELPPQLACGSWDGRSVRGGASCGASQGRAGVFGWHRGGHHANGMHRKNMRNISSSSCVGADLNRNFDAHWFREALRTSNVQTPIVDLLQMSEVNQCDFWRAVGGAHVDFSVCCVHSPPPPVGPGRPSAVCWRGQSSRGACRPANVSPIRV